MITLDVIKLKKSFGRHNVFSDVSFHYSGASLAIAGSNGSGKSTFLRCLGHLMRPTSGNFEWTQDGDVLEREEIRKSIGYSAPYINLYDELSCRENLHFLSKMRHLSMNADFIDLWIHKVELAHVADQPFGTLSTGQKQRLRLASALFHDPKILLLDEPGSNLDEAGRALVNSIAESYQSPERLLMIASNNPEELALCEKVYSIEEEQFV